MDPQRTGRMLKQLRVQRQLSLRALAALVYCDYSWLCNIEAGRRWPKDRGWAERFDLALQGGGELVAAWDADQREYATATDTMKMLEQARRDSRSFLLVPDSAPLDDIHDGIIHTAKTARFEPYDQTLTHALRLRTELMRRLKEGAHRPEHIRDLYICLGRVCGVLAYLTLDLGQADTAKVHAQAAFQLGDRADHDQLRAWARGTQALAFRFTKDFDQARDAAVDGLKYVGGSTGTAEPRLLCGLAASVANLGDSRQALEMLEQADRAREKCGTDDIAGLFSFSPAKQTYYHGFSLMWAADPKILKKSVTASDNAIAAWQAQRSPGDEMLSRIYLASAHTRLGDLDSSIAAVTPVLETPISAHFSWVRKRLNQLETLLGNHFPDSRPAGEMREVLHVYIHAM